MSLLEKVKSQALYAIPNADIVVCDQFVEYALRAETIDLMTAHCNIVGCMGGGYSMGARGNARWHEG